MTINQRISECLANTLLIKETYPAVETVRYELYNTPYSELLQFARTIKHTLYTDEKKQLAYIIYSPRNLNNQLDTDIWIYSTKLKIKPAEIIDEQVIDIAPKP